MPRTRKPRQTPNPDESPSTPPAESTSEDEDAANRASQLEQIRAAISTPAKADAEEEMPELPAPDITPPLELEAPEEPLELPAPAADASPEPPIAADPASSPPADQAVAAGGAALPTAPAQPPTGTWVPPPTYPPSSAPAQSTLDSSTRGASTSVALGIVLVVVGVFFLTIRLLSIDLSTNGWPLYVIIPGLTLLVVGFVSLGSGALIPGGIVTVTGLILAYQSVTDDWASWSYAWALAVPGGIGIGVLLQGLRTRDAKLTRQGRTLLFWALIIFLVGFVFFETILHVSGVDYGKVGQAALPALLIIIGVTLLLRSIRRGRSA